MTRAHGSLASTAVALAAAGRLSTPSRPSVRVAIAASHPAMRRSLRALLDATDGLRVVADAPDLDSAERLLAGAGADVFVLDLDRRGGSSGERVAVLRAHRPRTTVVAFGMHRGPDFVARALAAGAADYVPVDRVESDLAPAVRAAALTSDAADAANAGASAL